MEAIAIAAGATVICNAYVPLILGKKIVPKSDGIHYSRSLRGVGLVTKILLGNPKGFPTTSPKAPHCQTTAVNASFPFNDEDGDDIADLLSHYACELLT